MGNSAAKCLQCVPETGAAGERLSFWYTAYLVQKETDANRRPPHRRNRRRSSGALPPPSAAWSIMDPPNSDFRKSMHTVVLEDAPAPTPAPPPKPSEEKLAAIFAAVDTDKNGTVARTELAAKLAADDELQGLLKNAGLNPEVRRAQLLRKVVLRNSPTRLHTLSSVLRRRLRAELLRAARRRRHRHLGGGRARSGLRNGYGLRLGCGGVNGAARNDAGRRGCGGGNSICGCSG